MLEIFLNVFNAGHKLECDIDYSVRKFYTAANTIYSRSKFCSEISKLFLMETFYLPLISYGCECVNHDSNKKAMSSKQYCILHSAPSSINFLIT